jgi:hypothetical protein
MFLEIRIRNSLEIPGDSGPWTGLLGGFQPTDRFAPLAHAMAATNFFRLTRNCLSRLPSCRWGFSSPGRFPDPAHMFKERGGGHSDDKFLQEIETISYLGIFDYELIPIAILQFVCLTN